MTGRGNISRSDTFNPKHRQRSGQFKRLEKKKQARMGRTGAKSDCRGFHKHSTGRFHQYLEDTAALGPINSSFELR